MELEILVHEFVASTQSESAPFVLLVPHCQDNVAMSGRPSDGPEADWESVQILESGREIPGYEHGLEALDREDFVQDVFGRGHDAFEASLLVDVKVLRARVIVPGESNDKL